MKKIILSIMIIHIYAYSNSQQREFSQEISRQDTVRITANFITAFNAFQTLNPEHRLPIVQSLLRNLNTQEISYLAEYINGINALRQRQNPNPNPNPDIQN